MSFRGAEWQIEAGRPMGSLPLPDGTSIRFAQQEIAQ